MPWKEAEMSKLREEFILRALEPDVNLSELCREYESSRRTGYEWLQRLKEGGIEGLWERIRRTHKNGAYPGQIRRRNRLPQSSRARHHE